MAELVATMVVEPLLSIVKENLSSYLLDQYEVMKGMEAQHKILKRRLPAILDVITDAEQAASYRKGVKAWLDEVKAVAYQANEVFDEFKYEALRRKAKKEGYYQELGFGVVKLFPTHNRLVFRHRMGRKLRKIVQAIEVLVNEMNAFGFKYQQQPLITKQLRQTYHVIFDPKNITSRSRDKDKRFIVNILVGQANNTDLTVVPIVGMGGLGKTTLAQLVYSEPEIKKHFDLLLWVSVSDGFDVDFLAKSIAEADSNKKDGATEAAVEKKDDDTVAAADKKDAGIEAAVAFMKTPPDSLQSAMSRQRYLLVLDDVWKREVDKWEQLKTLLQHGGMGSVVLTTTRDEGVAKIMGTVKAYNLTALEDEFIKEIIESRAFGYLHKEEKRPDLLVAMVDEIVKRCVGSPLAATALGSVLRTKTSEEEWKALSSRSNICTEESGILPILNLSYNDLPSHMKQCFAFCAIFPKGYEIDVDKLIQLWIAHGFIIQEKQVRLETTGKKTFNDLASRSFFQDVKQARATYKEIKSTAACSSRTICKIHDLMHDVALSVMEKECALATEELCNIRSVVTPSQNEWLSNTARHLLLSCKEPARRLNSSLEKSSPAIQTLLCDSDMGNSSLQHLSKYSSLQALQLRAGTSFPLKPKHLHHLRYLDLSRSSITSLPEDMSILYNLQTLNLSGCIYLGGLPRQMKYMTALRHLYTHGCPKLKSMPRDLGKLTSLQSLTCFVAGSGSDCSNVRELRNLNLGGQLELRNLENVTEEDAKATNLVEKKELRQLKLEWTFGQTSCLDDARVLGNLKPHDGLHAIMINAYRATTCQAIFQNMVVIHLYNCIKLQWIFSCDSDTSFAFPKLEELNLINLVCLERLWEMDNDGMQKEIMFPQLEKLGIVLCRKLTALPGQAAFPNLRFVRIKECPELTARAKSPKLSQLTMEGLEIELLLWVARHATSLTYLDLTSHEASTETTLAADEHSFKEVVEDKKKGNDHDFPLTSLMLTNFKSCVTGLFACFVHLITLKIERCHALVYWPEKEFEGLVSLRKLEITNCGNLSGYAQGLAESSTSSDKRRLLLRLEMLEISSCGMLVEVFDVPASLRSMDIRDCSKLESTSGKRPQQGQSASSIHQVASLESSFGAGMEHLILVGCQGLTGVLHLPSSLKVLQIGQCHGLTSLESCSGELLSLEMLLLLQCCTLSSLPIGPQAYSSLRHLAIRDCPRMKMLPTSLQQQLGSIQYKNIDANYYGDTPRSMPSVKITEL